MKSIIVNADDFGLCESVNEGIIKAYREGIVTNTTLIANAYGFENALNLYRKYNIPVGIHLSLTNFISLSTNKKMLNDNFEVIKKIQKKEITLRKIYLELKEQIKKLLKNNVKITHIDSHKHIHMFPLIYMIIAKLIEEFNLPNKIRMLNESLTFDFNLIKKNKYYWFYLYKIKRWNNQNIYKFIKALSNNFCGYFYAGNLNKEILTDFIINLKKGTTEIMCHPGYNSDFLENISSLNRERENELNVLTDNKIKNLLTNLI